MKIKDTSTRILSIALLLSTMTIYQAPLEANGNFYRAIYEGDGVLKIDPFHKKNPILADWKSLIPKKYASIQLGAIPDHHVTEFYNKRNMFDNVELSFIKPAPKHLSSKFYYVISENGVREVRIERVDARIRFSLDRNQNSDIDRISHTGRLIPKEDLNYGDGFALVSPDKQELVTNAIKIPDGTILRFDTRYDKRDDIEIDSIDFDIETSFAFKNKTDSKKYIFIKFKPDPQAICYGRLLLVTDAPEFKVVRWNYFGCDV